MTQLNRLQNGKSNIGGVPLAKKKITVNSSDKRKMGMIIGAGIFAIVAIVVVVLLILFVPKGGDEASDGVDQNPTANLGGNLTEEDNAVTKQVIDEYAEVTVKGYQEIEDELGRHGAVIISVRNKSDSTASLAIDIAAKDKDGNVLDVSSLYAEQIGPGQSIDFPTFVYTTLSEDELKNAKFEVYKAYTYTAPGETEAVPAEEGVEDAEPVEAEPITEETPSVEEAPAETGELTE